LTHVRPDHLFPVFPGFTDIWPRRWIFIARFPTALGSSRPAPSVVGIGGTTTSVEDGCGMPAEPGRGQPPLVLDRGTPLAIVGLHFGEVLVIHMRQKLHRFFCHRNFVANIVFSNSKPDMPLLLSIPFIVFPDGKNDVNVIDVIVHDISLSCRRGALRLGLSPQPACDWSLLASRVKLALFEFVHDLFNLAFSLFHSALPF
jgi:hypothetical protein